MLSDTGAWKWNLLFVVRLLWLRITCCVESIQLVTLFKHCSCSQHVRSLYTPTGASNFNTNAFVQSAHHCMYVFYRACNVHAQDWLIFSTHQSECIALGSIVVIDDIYHYGDMARQYILDRVSRGHDLVQTTITLCTVPSVSISN